MKYYKVFGLWRSGTHYVEALLENNIEGAVLEIDYVSSSVYRHSFPDKITKEWMDEQHIPVIVARNPTEWMKSLRAKKAKWMSGGYGGIFPLDDTEGSITPATQEARGSKHPDRLIDYNWDEKSDGELKSYYLEFLTSWKEAGADVVSYEECMLNPRRFLWWFSDKHGLTLKNKLTYRSNKPLGGYSGYANNTAFDYARVLDIRENLNYKKVWNSYDVNKIPFYITSLERRPEKKAPILDYLLRYKNVLDVNIKQWGPDSKDIDNKLLKDINIKPYSKWKLKGSSNQWWNRELKLGEIGCAISHLRMWEDAYKKEHDFSIFTEDDLKFEKDWLVTFKNTVDKLEEWDLIYFGRAPPIGKDAPFNKELVKPSFSYCLHAYALSRSGLEKIMKLNYGNNIIPSDEFIPALYEQHPRKDISKLYKPIDGFKAYAYKTNLINQDKTISDTEESEDYVTP